MNQITTNTEHEQTPPKAAWLAPELKELSAKETEGKAGPNSEGLGGSGIT